MEGEEDGFDRSEEDTNEDEDNTLKIENKEDIEDKNESYDEVVVN